MAVKESHQVLGHLLLLTCLGSQSTMLKFNPIRYFHCIEHGIKLIESYTVSLVLRVLEHGRCQQGFDVSVFLKA